MNRQPFERFLRQASQDEALRARLLAVSDQEQFLAIASDAGYQLGHDDYQRYRDRFVVGEDWAKLEDTSTPSS